MHAVAARGRHTLALAPCLQVSVGGELEVWWISGRACLLPSSLRTLPAHAPPAPGPSRTAELAPPLPLSAPHPNLNHPRREAFFASTQDQNAALVRAQFRGSWKRMLQERPHLRFDGVCVRAGGRAGGRLGRAGCAVQ